MSRSELLGVFLAGLCLLSLSASAETYDSSGGKFELETSVGAIAHAWSPVKHRLPLYGGFEKTNFAYGSPVRSFVADGDRNELTLAWDEGVEAVDFSYRLVWDDQSDFKLKITLKSQGADFKVHVDRRKIHWSEAVQEAARWALERNGVGRAKPPAGAYEPLYSTWYAFKRDFDATRLEEELAEAAKLGMGTVIVDDGWQTTHGDWEADPAKFPDMRAHVARIHGYGMKYVLWYSLAFMNELSRHYKAFEGKYLETGQFWEHRLGILDPRFPEVRSFIADQLADRMRRWGVDGYKLDFLDMFRVFGENRYDYDSVGVDPAVKDGFRGRDTRSVPQAAEKLLEEIQTKLREVKGDALIEFRQPYFGPVTQKYGNLFRANDCPGDTLCNRVATTDTRLVTGSAAVHSDMLKWTPSSDRFDAARSILPVLFTTVQYSMDLKSIPAEQKAEIAKWVRFAREHRAALQEGGFRAYSPEANYPLLEGWSGTERIFVVYDPKTAVPTPVGDSRRLIVVNATPARRVLVETASGVKSVAVEPYGFGEVE